MATTFSSLPIVDLHPMELSHKLGKEQQRDLASRLYDVFTTTGFAYLVNHPLSFDHEAVFKLSMDFFSLPTNEKMKLAKRSFRKDHLNTYRGYFPTQPDLASDNLKEGFEIGPQNPMPLTSASNKTSNNIHLPKINLSEHNIWPAPTVFPSRQKLEQLHNELQSLASTLLSLLAISLGKDADFFSSYLTDSLSTLRLLHYPTTSSSAHSQGQELLGSGSVKLSCTPHTDSGILTLLHQDATGGLEVQNSDGKWVAAPYVPESIVVNIGDLMAKVSGGRFVATMHRVRAPPAAAPTLTSAAPISTNTVGTEHFGRFSVPFFFEPGEKCVIKSVDDADGVGAVVYGEHVRAKMKTWVEFRDL
ncbi:oxidoreductase [Histoplasma capsulatum var. duboisii H88]|uniref:2OG-Fe(II) oxygenase n=1 Tax=Ajellomyces capsulatus (strain H88) TaxID=544711 RepID=F0UJ61_AJEC8|nr:oxidoreductase [Histoplasma capsulatum var. duboisii H88]QSS56362.1 2OG-Fe(II) oxygenase [Histoplasma capsulatum var. duboisii H88]